MEAIRQASKTPSRVVPFHSLWQLVYHDHAGCTDAQTIDPPEVRAGTGYKNHCLQCKHLHKQTGA